MCRQESHFPDCLQVSSPLSPFSYKCVLFTPLFFDSDSLYQLTLPP